MADLRRRNLDGLRPLMLLCKDGASIAVLDEVLETLQKNNCREALAIAIQFASGIFTAPEDIRHLERKRKMLKDVLRDTWTYQQIVNEGIEEGFEKGIEEGKDIGVQESITAVIQGRFPELETYVKEFITSLADKMQLKTILLIVATAQTPEEVKQKLTVLMQH